MKRFGILIPYYKEINKDVDIIEYINLKKLSDLCENKGYDLIVLTYSDDLYEHAKSNFPSFNVKFLIDKKYFKNTSEYSMMMCTPLIWKSLAEYKYMYILQDDVYIFSDQFEKWVSYCERYDISYCGAPIIGMNASWGITKTNPVGKVGNGGFSLRKISTMIELTSPDFLRHFNINSQDELNTLLINESGPMSIMEDVFFCVWCYERYDFNILDLNKAFSFSWDMNPDVIVKMLFNLNDMPLIDEANDDFEKAVKVKNILNDPEFKTNFNRFNLFGAHATKKNIDFWVNIIPEYISIALNNPEYIKSLIEYYKTNKYLISRLFVDIDEKIKNS